MTRTGLILFSLLSLVPGQLSAAPALTNAELDGLWENRHQKCDAYLALGKEKPAVPQNYDIAWRVARAIYYGGFFCFPDNTEGSVKVPYFEYGVQASRIANKLNPDGVEGYYWFASTYGGYGLSKGIRDALGGAEDMLVALTKLIGDADKQEKGIREKAAPIAKPDPDYHFAGPLRLRGRLRNQLPGTWPLNYGGDNSKALADLKRAVFEFKSQARLTYIYLADVQASEESKEAALKTLEMAEKLPDVGGVSEEAAWKRELAALKKKLQGK